MEMIFFVCEDSKLRPGLSRSLLVRPVFVLPLTQIDLSFSASATDSRPTNNADDAADLPDNPSSRASGAGTSK